MRGENSTRFVRNPKSRNGAERARLDERAPWVASDLPGFARRDFHCRPLSECIFRCAVNVAHTGAHLASSGIRELVRKSLKTTTILTNQPLIVPGIGSQSISRDKDLDTRLSSCESAANVRSDERSLCWHHVGGARSSGDFILPAGIPSATAGRGRR